jgi:hypothetical protein
MVVSQWRLKRESSDRPTIIDGEPDHAWTGRKVREAEQREYLLKYWPQALRDAGKLFLMCIGALAILKALYHGLELTTWP